LDEPLRDASSPEVLGVLSIRLSSPTRDYFTHWLSGLLVRIQKAIVPIRSAFCRASRVSRLAIAQLLSSDDPLSDAMAYQYAAILVDEFQFESWLPFVFALSLGQTDSRKEQSQRQ
jgi:hypothetical protein